MVGGASAVDTNVLPFGLVSGNRAKLRGVNLVGLRRSGVASKTIVNLLKTFRYLFPDSLGTKTSAFARSWDLDSPEELKARCEQVQRAMDEGDIERCSMILAVLDAIDIQNKSK